MSKLPRPSPTVIGSVAVAAAALVAFLVFAGGSDSGGQSSDVAGQGGSASTLAENAATLFRRNDGFWAEIEVPVPAPGTYEYPTGDMVAPWAEPHPPVSPGASRAPEVFTVWLLAFNNPSACTDQSCDVDDIGIDTPARGGVYQLDGRVADGDVLRLVGGIRLGQPPATGAPLDDPARAEVHVAIAPHGRALSGADRWRQLNGPIGNPQFWWVATFPALGG